MQTIIISLGGSIIVPDDIDAGFLKGFKKLILRKTKSTKRVKSTKSSENKRFIIITGGGKTARKYQKAASEISGLHPEDIDWIGIHATRLNAHLLRTIFRGYAYPAIIKNPNKKISTTKKIMIAAGWKPGCSTDYDAVLLARNFGVKTIINLSNIEKVYTKDPNKYPDARPIDKISWQDFRKIVGDRWDPGLNTPFDPVASKIAEQLRLKVIIAKGTNLKNLEKIIEGKRFVGTTIV